MKLIPNLSEIDRQTTARYGIASTQLMENAGREVMAQVLVAMASRELLDPAILILCGPGNNGGDGLVCARLLWEAGYHRLQVILLSPPTADDARQNLERLRKTKCPINEKLDDALISEADIVIDALFGSGLNRPLAGLVTYWIQAVNTSPQRPSQWVLAVDTPSGIDAGTGKIMGAAIRADATVTFATAKPGLYLGDGRAQSGQVAIADIGIPDTLIQVDASRVFLLDAAKARQCLPKRNPTGHKYSMGHVLVIAGSKRMPGAAALCSEAALTAGAGVVTLAAPESVFTQIQIRSELLRLPLPENPHGEVTMKVVESVLPALDRCDAVLLGPGLGDVSEFFKALLTRLKTLQVPVVLDADGLNALARERKHTLNAQFIVTPHLGEAGRLLKTDANLAEDLLASAQQVQQDTQAIVVLKSATSLVALPEENVWINNTGNHGMATAGSGDVLAGIIAGLAAQSKNAESAALAGVYLHGLAGDLAMHARTAYCVRAGDITDYLPQAFQQLG